MAAAIDLDEDVSLSNTDDAKMTSTVNGSVAVALDAEDDFDWETYM